MLVVYTIVVRTRENSTRETRTPWYMGSAILVVSVVLWEPYSEYQNICINAPAGPGAQLRVPRRHTHTWDGLHTRHLLESTHTNTQNIWVLWGLRRACGMRLGPLARRGIADCGLALAPAAFSAARPSDYRAMHSAAPSAV